MPTDFQLAARDFDRMRENTVLGAWTSLADLRPGIDHRLELGDGHTVWYRVSFGTTLSGSISTILIVLSWGFVSIHTCGVLPYPVCALNWPI